MSKNQKQNPLFHQVIAPAIIRIGFDVGAMLRFAGVVFAVITALTAVACSVVFWDDLGLLVREGLGVFTKFFYAAAAAWITGTLLHVASYLLLVRWISPARRRGRMF